MPGDNKFYMSAVWFLSSRADKASMNCAGTSANLMKCAHERVKQ